VAETSYFTNDLYMKPYCANPTKNFGKFGKPSSLVFRLTLFRSMVLLTVILSPLSPDILNKHVNQLVKIAMRLLKPNTNRIEQRILALH